MRRRAHLIPRRRALVRLLSYVLLLGALSAPTVGESAADDRPDARLRVGVAKASDTSITVTWTVSDEPAAFQFVVVLDGARVASTTKTRHTITGLECGRAYTVVVVLVEPTGAGLGRAALVTATSRCTEDGGSVLTRHPAPATLTVSPAVPARPTPVPTPDRALPEPTPPSSSDTADEHAMTVGPVWQGAGAFVWHETDVSPEALGRELRDSGFAWVALRIHDGLAVDAIEDDWSRRFREESGLPVGGWGVLRSDPEEEAALALDLVDRYALDFYIANPEAEYKYTGDDGSSDERFGRSKRFVDTFRLSGPQVDAAVSSYCRADTADLDWRAWSGSGFAFLPQAYVNDIGKTASPAACAAGASDFFESSAVHPTIGVYRSGGDAPDVSRYASLLEDAGTVGFSVYLAETDMTMREWRILGDAIAGDVVARHPSLLTGARPPQGEHSPAKSTSS
jgi:hypothetical protein